MSPLEVARMLRAEATQARALQVNTEFFPAQIIVSVDLADFVAAYIEWKESLDDQTD